MTEIINNDALFAKQSILDANNNLFGFEILYRDSSENRASIDDRTIATAELLINYCVGLIEGATTPYVKIFININHQLLMSDYFFPLPPNRIVLELHSDIEVDVDLLIRVSELKNVGYAFAIDNYTFEERFDTLLSLIDYLKVDTTTFPLKEINSNYETLLRDRLKSSQTKPIMIASKIETAEAYTICNELNFSLFQGYFLAKPTMEYGKKLESNKQNALNLSTALQKDDISIQAVCDLISQDVQLSYIILKVVNSPICNLPRKIESLYEGITYLGLRQVKQWAMILSLSGKSTVPNALLRLLLERAKICELYSSKLKLENCDSFFTIGLFSGIDLILHVDKAWLLKQIGFSVKVTNAILDFSGARGKVLRQVVALEEGRLDELETLTPEEKTLIVESSVEAAKWVHELAPLIESSN